MLSNNELFADKENRDPHPIRFVTNLIRTVLVKVIIGQLKKLVMERVRVDQQRIKTSEFVCEKWFEYGQKPKENG